jgi:ketol-acid reductoisomerase
VTEKRIFSDADLNTAVLCGKQIGLIGYGSQGRAQALNLRDSGFTPLIGNRRGKSFTKAEADGFRPASIKEVAALSDILMVVVPDETQAAICNHEVIPCAREGTFIGFSTGFAVHYGLIRFGEGFKVFLTAPKGPGGVLRARYLEGGGIPALVASFGDDADAMNVATAYAKAIGCARAGVIKSTFSEEAVADLFGEQCVLTGGLIELMKAAFEVLVARGYSPEVAYIECIAEVEYMASLVAQVGLPNLSAHISSTSHYGGVTRGRRLIDAETKAKLNGILDEIEGGGFLEEFRAHVEAGGCLETGYELRDLLVKTKACLDEVGGHGK